MIWRKDGELRCWSCHEWVSNNELENADGFCPHCDSEIDTSEVPYVKQPPEECHPADEMSQYQDYPYDN